MTPGWLTAALSQDFPGAVVSEVTVGTVEDGTNQRAALTVRYRSGEGPDRIFIKGPGRLFNRLALLALGAWDSEARLFGSEMSLPLEHATAYAAGWRRASASAVVLLEDITLRGGQPNDPVTPLTVAQVRDGLAGLARLHAAYWGHPPAADFAAPWRLGRALAPVSAASLAWARRRLRRLGRPDLFPAGVLLLERQFREWTWTAATGPRTLLHGDPHPGNTFSLPSDRIGFYDWQLVRTGNWAHDVGYFLVSSLTASDRRAHERALIDGYLDALGTAVTPAPAPTADDAWLLYRKSPAFGLCSWLHTLSGGGFQPLPACLAVLTRFAAAYTDHATATL